MVVMEITVELLIRTPVSIKTNGFIRRFLWPSFYYRSLTVMWAHLTKNCGKLHGFVFRRHNRLVLVIIKFYGWSDHRVLLRPSISIHVWPCAYGAWHGVAIRRIVFTSARCRQRRINRRLWPCINTAPMDIITLCQMQRYAFDRWTMKRYKNDW